MATKRPRSLKLRHPLIAWGQLTVATALNLYLISKLVFMQFDSIFPVIGIGLGLLIGFTGLMFNRARAYPEGKVQRRSIFAAEMGLKAIGLQVVAISMGGVIFYLLTITHVSPNYTLSIYKQHWLLYLGAVLPVAISVSGQLEIYKALNYILPPVLKDPAHKKVLRTMQARKKKPTVFRD